MTGVLFRLLCIGILASVGWQAVDDHVIVAMRTGVEHVGSVLDGTCTTPPC